MIDFTPEETQRQMVETAAKFGREVLRPAEVALDLVADPVEVFKSDLYWKTMAQAFELGFNRMAFPESMGGLDLDPITNGMVWEELGYCGAGFAASLMSCAVAQRLIAFLAPDNRELVEKYVVPFCTDTTARTLSAWGSSEPDVGSDGKNYYDPAVRHRTTAVKKGDRWVINGTKSNFISNGSVAGLYVVFANVDPALGIRGSGAFIVPGDAPGVARGNAIDKLGLRVLNQAPIYFDNVEVPENYMIFPPGEGYPFLHQSIITVGSVGVGYLAVGTLRAAYEHALAYSKERIQWGKPIFEHQLIAQKLYDAHQAIETARLLLWKASWRCKAGFPGDLQTSLTARIYATHQAYLHTSELVQVLGGYGISKEYPLEKYMRDARLLPIMDGTNETLMLKAASLL
jgi:alkylation response protein AidB-like acyl-CoA dehydrogenase